MTVGDPKKAKLLAIVAIGAVAFMVIELLPGAGDGPYGSSRRLDEHPIVVASARGATRLVRDPFSSALLLKASEQAASPAPSKEKPQAATQPGSAEPHSHLAGLEAPPLGPMDLAPVHVAGLPATAPKETTTSNRAKVSGNETLLTVQATLRIDDEVAMISVGKDGPKEYRTGARLASGVRVTSIDSDGVVLDNHGNRVRVEVGQAVKI